MRYSKLRAKTLCAFRCDTPAIADLRMVGHPGLSSELAPASHLDRARQADLCGEARVFANLAVVANMHVVVELCAAPDQGRAHRGTVDSGQRADFHLVLDHDRADL